MKIPHTLHSTIIVLAAIASMLFASCSKDTPAKPKTATELISQAPWHWTKKQLSNKGGAPVEQPLSDVQKSAVYTFKADGTFTVVGNADGSTTVGTWAVTDAKTFTLTTTDEDGKTVTGSIGFTVSETTFVMTIVGTFYSPDPNGTATSLVWDTQISTFNHL
jgi:hypothetical protein